MLSQSIPDVVNSIHSHPDLKVVMIYRKNLEVLKGLLSKSSNGLPSIGLFVDTTFNLGDFYLSIVSFNDVNSFNRL